LGVLVEVVEVRLDQRFAALAATAAEQAQKAPAPYLQPLGHQTLEAAAAAPPTKPPRLALAALAL
jgi:hypothetical protein